MKVSMKWLKQYADIPVSPAEYESRMVMTGTGVEGTSALGEIENVVVGRVLTCRDHENSDHLHVCTVDVGEAEPLQIVCGAPNVREGILVPVAKIGARLPGGMVIKKGKMRGVESYGMLCSGPEIGVPVELYPSVGTAGLLIFREDYPVGSDVRPIFGLDDTVIDFEILANRPDCLSVWGVARETAAAMGTALRLPEITVRESDGDIRDYARVDVLEEALCPRYAAKVVKNVRIGESPAWLRQYLYAAGMRSINNMVDITNFIMLETGHPMHAFDLDKVRGRHIIVRKAANGEKLTTLDGKEYALNGTELMICDETGPTGLAGIMGGEESEITESTKEVLFECAAFDRTSIRVTARSLGIRTESSGRFERGVAPATVMDALLRACQMVNELDAGDVVPGAIDLYPHPAAPVTLTVSCARMARRAGVEIAPEEMEEILKKLQFTVSRHGDEMTVTAPAFRQDIEQEADICEEVLRYAGYDRIPITHLRGETLMGGNNEKGARMSALRRQLTGMGFYESMTFSFISQKAIAQLGLAPEDPRNQPLMVRNPLGEDTACMRTSLLPGLLKTLSTNIKNGNENGRLYEMGTIFDALHRTAEGLPTELPGLALGMYGACDFYAIRGVVEALCRRAGIAYQIASCDEPYLHPGRRAALTAEGKVIAVMGEMHPDAAEHFDIPGRCYVAQIDLPVFFALSRPLDTVKSVARFPAVNRDLALVMKDSQQVGPLMDAIRTGCGALLEDIRMFDVFRGVQIGPGNKSVAFSLTYRAADHTLTEEEITRLTEKALRIAREKFDAVLRM
ncbi:MAG: phenylalanine--tRNA ligase subunit beta [Clostridiales bacterium]|nr:phenylalanine--tRNA ligase subunit beta [Clostridiales bacterium]